MGRRHGIYGCYSKKLTKPNRQFTVEARKVVRQVIRVRRSWIKVLDKLILLSELRLPPKLLIWWVPLPLRLVMVRSDFFSRLCSCSANRLVAWSLVMSLPESPSILLSVRPPPSCLKVLKSRSKNARGLLSAMCTRLPG